MNKKYYKYIFITTVISFVIFFIYLIIYLYSLTLEDAKKNHQIQQLQMAKVVAEGINYFMEHLVKDMRLLTDYSNIKDSRNILLKDFISHFRQNYDQRIISSIIILDSLALINSYSGIAPPDWAQKKITEMAPRLAEDMLRYEFLASEIIQTESLNKDSDRLFLIVLPINKSSIKLPSKRNTYIAFIVNFDSLIEHFILSVELNSNDFIWILDGNGRLIYHPNHEEMLFNSIYDEDKECLSCHISFDNQKEMLRSTKPSLGEHWGVGDEPGKIFAYVPVNIENQKWFIAISTILPDVTAGLRDKFQLFFILGIIILLTFLFFIFLIYYLNMKRIKSEEIRKNLEKIRDYQEQLYHSSRLASIGELVDSVAHEINTPIGIISAHAESIMLKEDQSGIYQEELDIIKKHTKRISDYTKSLLNFSKRIAFNPENVNIIDLINESIYLLQPRFREKKVEIHKRFPVSQIAVWGDKRQLEQVLINIFNNSIDSINVNGKIIIELKEQNILRNKINDDQLTESVIISITDNGSGIKNEYLDKIFDPFYTTKEKNGTGLGLSISKSIIQRHRGTINVISEPDKGTTFSVILPKNVK